MARGSATLLISGINERMAERAGNGEHPDRSLTPQGRAVPRSSKARPGRRCATAGEQNKLLGVKRNKTCLFYPFQQRAGLGDRQQWIFVVCLDNQDTKLTSNREPLQTFDPFSPRVNPMLFLNWNQEISWLRSLAG